MSYEFIHHYACNSWGDEVFIMEKNGKGFGRVYWFNEDKTSAILCWLSVNEDERKKGLGTKLQEIREDIAKIIGATTTFLWVEKGSWMYEWYKRRGYEDYKDHEEEDCIWMKKQLINL